MFSKSKYDVMESISSKSTMSLLFLVGKVAKDLKLYENKKISKVEFENRFNNNLSSGLPNIKAICHIGYENSKDIVDVSEEELYRYMKKEGLTKDQFNANYMMMINTYVRVILAFDIMDKENIDVFSVMSPGVLLGLVKGDFSKLRDKVEEVGVNLSKDNQVLIDKLVSKDFDVSMLTNVEMKELERVHSKYMDRNVNGKVTDSYDKTKALRFAKSLGKKKSVFEL